ncbi:hypothetical protein AB0J63_49420 [Streptosporangium canum]|uniref:hypothetical protein n=1 Tax=Streptosporangium canum TaxID=324952 RepID=UPI00342CD8F8
MKTPHITFRTGAVRATVITGALCLGLSALTQPSHADAPGNEPVVINGDFALPAITGSSPDSAAVRGWSVGSTSGSGTPAGVQRYSATASGHPGGKVAVMLRLPVATHSFKQRLRNVRKGAQVTVTFDDSPSVASVCTPTALAQGQRYTVDGFGGQVLQQTTDRDPNKRVGAPGAGAWRIGQTYTFTAGEQDPLLTFTSQVPTADNAGGSCGPMIANVRVVQIPPSVDKSIPKNALPPSAAFLGNDRKTVEEAVSYCIGASDRCVFTEETSHSYTYYEPPQINGETLINCTRNALDHTRPLTAASGSYGTLPASAGLPGTGPAASNMESQLNAGLKIPLVWKASANGSVKSIIQTAEVEWVENQGGRRRTEGRFASNPTTLTDPHSEWRLYAAFDSPSPELSTRFYERTGPMTISEEQRCQSDRPTASTPVGAGTPAGPNSP